ncbi:hypothetical protein N7462_008699 [Penicillium macrosclerotiorum]|uniref:uncharacterized protein n=1 Tax=Penicillium macrosclerotiorum TaxID=303699 RepID=UPI002546BB04|nr:uncharacterized protein N7462_008699 [Penicillium macrosclerotiorum]KAJ5675802.1 hypothetical protein N7462_008699 [Penicillium macrosclerotiorum]
MPKRKVSEGFLQKKGGKDRDQTRYGMVRDPREDFYDGQKKLDNSRRRALTNLDPRGLAKAEKKEITDKFPEYREKPVLDDGKLQNFPPPNVALTDEWVEIVCGQVPNRERGQKWALGFNTQGDISADRNQSTQLR